MGRAEHRLDALLLAAVVLGPIQWITLLNVGLALKPVHVPLALMALLAMTTPAASLGFLTQQLSRPPQAVFWGALALYLYVLTASAMWSDAPFRGLSFLFKQVVYGGLALGFAAYLIRCPRGSVWRTAAWAGLASAGSFFLIASLVLESRGVSMVGLVTTAIATADYKRLQFGLFLYLFNTTEALRTGDALGTPLRHTSLAFIGLAMVLSAAALQTKHLLRRDRIAAWVGIAACLALVLISVSRSTLLASVLAFATMGMGFLINRNMPRVPMWAGLVLIVAGTLSASVLLVTGGGGVGQIVATRLGEVAHDGRLLIYAASLDRMEGYELFGHGVGAQVPFLGKEGYVHNSILAGYYMAGIPGLFAALAYVAGLVWIYFDSLKPGQPPAAYALAGLLAFPIMRSMVGGENGAFNLADWLCVGVVLALSVRPAARRARGMVPVTL